VRDSLRVSFGTHTNSRMKVVAAEDGQSKESDETL
jgi:hypothetical protein